MQREIEEEIEDEITLADEQFRREKEVHAQIVKKRKLQTIRKVYFVQLLVTFIDFFSFIERGKKACR